MKQGIILLAITIILIAVCGCTQTPATPPHLTNPTTPAITTESQTFVTTPTQQKTPAVSDNTIRIKNLAFDQVNINVHTGSTVRWVNLDSVPHRIVFEDGADSTVLAASQSWSRKFDEAGTYKYACTIHPTMQGTVIVD
jgi:OOP family OmpA-OmpF porin